jgi:serine/threonine protein kinase
LIELLNAPPFRDARRYYKAVRGGQLLFIKSDSHDLSSEYRLTRMMFERDKNYFVEPIDFCKGKVNYILMNWSEGTRLDEYVRQNRLTKSQKGKLVEDLHRISKLLYAAGIVHRDLIPRNFLVSNGRLKLIDFHFAVEYDNFHELDYVKEDIAAVNLLGESFAAGMYKWDDAFSFVKIADYILGDDIRVAYPAIQKMAKKIGERVIVPDGAIFSKIIVKQQKQINEQQSMIDGLREEITAKDAIIVRESQRVQDMEKSKSYRVGRKVTAPYKLLRSVNNKSRDRLLKSVKKYNSTETKKNED